MAPTSSIDSSLELIERLELPTPLTLAGVSMGGAISVLFAERHPELVNGLILVDPAGFPMPMPLAVEAAAACRGSASS